ncbi:MAG: hypothetical protein ABSG92_03305 [Conexivisphaerales archaeon]|jgi:uncharacterized membrane protein (DUF2068 family)
MTFAPKVRPLGITVLSILGAVGAVLSVLLGAALVISTPDLISMLIKLDPSYSTVGNDVLALSIQIVAAFFVVVGLVALLNGYGLWKGKAWAWWITVSLALLGAFSSIFILPMGAVSLGIELLIIYYMLRPSVRLYFRPQAETLPLTSA